MSAENTNEPSPEEITRMETSRLARMQESFAKKEASLSDRIDQNGVIKKAYEPTGDQIDRAHQVMEYELDGEKALNDVEEARRTAGQAKKTEGDVSNPGQKGPEQTPAGTQKKSEKKTDPKKTTPKASSSPEGGPTGESSEKASTPETKPATTQAEGETRVSPDAISDADFDAMLENFKKTKESEEGAIAAVLHEYITKNAEKGAAYNDIYAKLNEKGFSREQIVDANIYNYVKDNHEKYEYQPCYEELYTKKYTREEIVDTNIQHYLRERPDG